MIVDSKIVQELGRDKVFGIDGARLRQQFTKEVKVGEKKGEINPPKAASQLDPVEAAKEGSPLKKSRTMLSNVTISSVDEKPATVPTASSLFNLPAALKSDFGFPPQEGGLHFGAEEWNNSSTSNGVTSIHSSLHGDDFPLSVSRGFDEESVIGHNSTLLSGLEDTKADHLFFLEGNSFASPSHSPRSSRSPLNSVLSSSFSRKRSRGGHSQSHEDILDKDKTGDRKEMKELAAVESDFVDLKTENPLKNDL